MNLTSRPLSADNTQSVWTQVLLTSARNEIESLTCQRDSANRKLERATEAYARGCVTPGGHHVRAWAWCRLVLGAGGVWCGWMAHAYPIFWIPPLVGLAAGVGLLVSGVLDDDRG